MSQRYNDNTKKPKPKENQLTSKFGRGPQVQERVLLAFLSMRIHLKSCCILPLKFVTTLLI